MHIRNDDRTSVLYMTRYKCTVSYIGANYDGWQSQTNKNGIQDIIEDAFLRISKEPIKIVAAGRTDAKVNAKGQVFHFDSDMDLSAYKWKGALNGYLPSDIYIKDIEEVSDTFHARYCVAYKHYDYRINLHEYDVFLKDISTFIPQKLNIEKMKEASNYFLGEHDFTSFNASSKEEYPDQVRTIREIKFLEEDNLLTISFYAKGFLRYMVRMMVAALIEVGKGNLEPSDIEKILEEKSKRALSKNAEPQGLTLEEIYYFEILSLNDDGMIREFLDEDSKPNDKENIYAFTTRNTQELLGYLEVNDTSILHVFDEKDVDIAKSLLEGLNKELNTEIIVDEK